MTRLKKEMHKRMRAGWVFPFTLAGFRSVLCPTQRGVIRFGKLDRANWLKDARTPLRLDGDYAELY